jgi:uncharacterized cupin superfamily protein
MVYKRNLDDMEWQEMSHGSRFHSQRKTLTPFDEGPAPNLGISLYRLEPGKRAFPFHMHMANDEALLVVSGTGTLRYGAEEIALKAQDYVHLPAGSGKAHQMANTGNEPLLYYCLSTILLPEVIHYPDTGKVATAGIVMDDEGHPQRTRAIFHPQDTGYWDGEAQD